jgi:hypothetical protein
MRPRTTAQRHGGYGEKKFMQGFNKLMRSKNIERGEGWWLGFRNTMPQPLLFI